MNKKLSLFGASIALCCCLGAGWPTELDVRPNPTAQVRPDSPRLAHNLWQDSCYLAIIDTHLNEFVSLLELPKGWVGNSSIWNHHTMMIRTIGLVSNTGASAFILVNTEDRLNKPLSAIDEKEIKKVNQPWEKIITTMYPLHKLDEEKDQQLLSWHTFPAQLEEALRKASPNLTQVKRGRFLKLYTLTHEEKDEEIHVALVCDFDLYETNAKGKTTTLLRNRHVKICFVPEGADMQKTVVDAAKVARQAEEISKNWESKWVAHLKKPEDCSRPEGRAYSINSLSKELGDLQALPFKLCTNTFTGEHVRVPSAGGSCWVDAKGSYMFVNTTNPNDYSPLNKIEWHKVR
ncbi:MAG: hypothetical protein Q4F00_08360 [bacterium]|nr:hypothetical protein [bacterium]